MNIKIVVSIFAFLFMISLSGCGSKIGQRVVIDNDRIKVYNKYTDGKEKLAFSTYTTAVLERYGDNACRVHSGLVRMSASYLVLCSCDSIDKMISESKSK